MNADAEPLLPQMRPMLATPGPLPAAGRDADFGYEMKWDGVRAVVYVDRGQVRVLTRNDRDVTKTYPELCGLVVVADDHNLVLDGEIVAFHPATGRVSFGTLQRRMHVTDAARVRRLAREVPVTYLVFDVLHARGRDTIRLPYRERRHLLESLQLRDRHWDTPPYFLGGRDVVAASREQGLEGVVAKRLASTYEPGRRSPDWIKVKHTSTQEVVLGGWKPGQGRRAETIGSLLLGIPGQHGLEYVGHVGTGFTSQMLRDLHRMLRPLERRSPPFAGQLPAPVRKDAHWTEPHLVGEVEFGEWTADGRMRHPSWRGLRPDKSPDEVIRES